MPDQREHARVVASVLSIDLYNPLPYMKHRIAHVTAPNQPARVKVFAAITSILCLKRENPREPPGTLLALCSDVMGSAISFQSLKNL